MSLSKSEKQLPQYCAWHPRGQWRTFQASDGRFLYNNTIFVCRGCLNGRRQKPHKVKSVATKRTSPIEEQVVKALSRKHYDFRTQFEMGPFKFDFAFPRLKVLLDVDGWRWHQKNPGGVDTSGSRENMAVTHGWRLVHVKNGPHLVERALQAVVEAAYGESVVTA